MASSEKTHKAPEANTSKKRKLEKPDRKDHKTSQPSKDTSQPDSKKRKVEELYDTSTSKEAHAKQRQLTKDRKLAKPHASETERAKKIWERLRRKSHVPLSERKTLVAELFEIITGRVHDFVFKHDSVRTIQTALKYASPEQRKTIANELRGSYRTLVEGRYSKFLVAKVLVEGDKETREMVVREFYGHVRKLINHPEASWVVDDTYRQVATPAQKTRMLREWYGPEYSILKTSGGGEEVTADLVEILAKSPEKRLPTLKYLHGMIDALVQKRMTAFTMLHDAMLQYSRVIAAEPAAFATGSASEVINDWVALLRPDEEQDHDLLKNLAFTPSGVRVVTRALAMGTAKDRRTMLRAYKENVETAACDANAVHVILAAYEVVDDTRMSAKLVFPELLAEKIVDQEEREAAIAAIAAHPAGRTAVLWPIVTEDGVAPKWLVQPGSFTETVLREINEIKAVAGTSKKQNSTRRQELLQALVTSSDGAIYTTIASQASELASSSFGCQFMTEVLVHTGGAAKSDAKLEKKFQKALQAVADLGDGEPSPEHPVAGSAAAGRMLKTLAQGGPFDPNTKTTKHVDWLLEFPTMLWETIAPHVGKWATGSNSFVVLALVENEEFNSRKKVLEKLKKHKDVIASAAGEGNKGAEILKDML